MTETDRILNVALDLAAIAAAHSARALHGTMTVSYKPDGSALTQTDLSIETAWRHHIRREFPTHGILGEEFGTEHGSSAYDWVLDPIDGTRQFGAGLLNFASLIGICRDGIPVIGIIDLPVPGARYIGVAGSGTTFAGQPVHSNGQRRLDEAVISLANPDSFTGDCARGYDLMRGQGRVRVFDGGSPAYGALARGLIDICLNAGDLDAHDICALCPIVQEAGGTITDWSGAPLTITSTGAIAASASASLHRAVLDRLA